MSEWISVEKRLPHRLTPVIVHVPSLKEYEIADNVIYIASLCDWIEMCNDWHFLPFGCQPNDVPFEYVTHWMPLPELPRGLNNE